MDPLKQFLLGVALPGGICLLVLAIAWATATSRREYSNRHWSGAVGAGLGFAAGFYFLLGWPGLPPTDAVKWLPWFALAGMLIGVVDGSSNMPYMLTWIVRIAASGAASWMLLEPNIRRNWTSDESMRWVSGLTVGITLVWGVLDEVARRIKGWPLPWALALASVALSFTMLWSASAQYMQIGLLLAAVLGAAALVSLWRPAFSLSGGLLPVFCLVYYGLLICGYWYTRDWVMFNLDDFGYQQLCLPLLALAPLMALFGLGPKLQRAPRKQAALVFFLIVIPAVAAMLMAKAYVGESALDYM
jgi:hypothetical protein